MGWPARLGLLLGAALLLVVGGKLPSPGLLAAFRGSAPALACASVYHLLPILLYTSSWRALLPPASGPSFGRLLWLRWMGESINALLPVAQVGGDLVRARRLVRVGVPAPDAGASMIGDLTMGFASQVAFTVLGLLALAWRAGDRGAGRPALLALIAGAGLVPLLAATLLLVGLGPGRLAARLPWWTRLTARWQGLAGGAARLDAAVRALLRRRAGLAAAFLWHLAGWLSQIGETWLVLAVGGRPIAWSEALIIESLAATARAAAFVVPAGLGVQEAAVVGVGQHLGLPAEAAAALGLVKRLRELAVGLPGLLVWISTSGKVVAEP